MFYMHILIGDGSPLFYQTVHTYENAVAPGTAQNRLRQAKAYLSFSVAYNTDYLHPSPLDAAMFAQFLTNSHSSAASMKNYLSGARHWIVEHRGNISSFSAQDVQELIRKLTSQSNHCPAPALPITAREIKIICQFLDCNPSFPPAVKPCLLISYACMFRSSNVVSPSTKVWGRAHTLMAKDLWVTVSGLKVIVRSTKTLKNTSRPVLLHVYPASDDSVCPVRAWVSYLRTTNLSNLGPAFLAEDRRPLTAGPVVAAIRAALSNSGYENASKYSMHSLRRGAVQQAQSLRASQQDLMSHGLWRSPSGLSHYTSTSNQVARLLASSSAN